ncbi:MAG: M23 family metallopeptidase [Balneolaceae bacterium]|nr:M23 family metallopeptidase [Balneolaceae bacterium]MBO6546777.1 M23 family metallopeptidase [Balneolaceae bacterium]MBO6649137.1 M23 family metallopeptidase [Balneolaceae bacterium]
MFSINKILLFGVLLLVIQACSNEPGITEPEINSGSTFTPPAPSKILWPFEGAVTSESWFVTRGHGVATHKNSDYYGLDYSLPNKEECLGQPFRAPFSGTVLFSSPETQDNAVYAAYGNQVIIHSSADTTFALRVAHFTSTKVYAGDVIDEGDILGLVGSTGNSTGCHAHISLYRNIYTGVKYDYDASEIPAIEELKEGESINTSLSGFPKEVFATPFEFVFEADSITFNRDKSVEQ